MCEEGRVWTKLLRTCFCCGRASYLQPLIKSMQLSPSKNMGPVLLDHLSLLGEAVFTQMCTVFILCGVECAQHAMCYRVRDLLASVYTQSQQGQDLLLPQSLAVAYGNKWWIPILTLWRLPGDGYLATSLCHGSGQRQTTPCWITEGRSKEHL